MAIMSSKCVRHLPVLDDDKLIGLVSIGYIVKSIIDSQEHEIDNLINYIGGTY